MPKVAILMGSKTDDEIMQNCEKYLQYFGVDYEKRVLSAHRNPLETIEFARNAEANGYKVIIAAAGMAAHLPGVIAANTTLPVIGVPLPASELQGVDALYSIVQMPPGIPVATVAIGKAGAINAAVLAVEILALQDAELKKKLEEFKKQGSKL
ncbi:MAG: 5-(carboxyamino)imidazole ribonucleotide mutase [Candidatus Kryptonium sp.]|nr:5-(carboxyamino)imidazole ribonucleotide mutase [Candidatus Kryptonium sp.]MDW8109489.1 5-(carboxyamino)imidazole ribonucleotide mutase [Candidatus Kryptonium sp.]